MKISVLLLFGIISGASMLPAQAISVGVKGGFPFADPTSSTSSTNDESPPYFVGPSVEVRLPFRFAIEADALYRRIGNTVNVVNSQPAPGTAGITSYLTRERGNSWEFPVLGKYYLHDHEFLGWQPFVGAGFSFRTVGFNNSSSQTAVNAAGQTSTSIITSSFRTNLDTGATFSAGLRFHRGPIALTPEFRYTRWGNLNGVLVQNDAKFLLGISF